MKLFRWFEIFFCKHESVHRVKNGRWFLECIKCQAVSPGVQINALRNS